MAIDRGFRPRADGGSFRDPRSQVFLDGDVVVRALSDRGAADFAALEASGFYRRALEDGSLIPTERADRSLADALGDLRWSEALLHQRVPVVSYPYEWSFSMLRDAALLHLDVVRRALADGLSCKDGTAYNLQFVGARPTFIDVGSFEPLTADPWPGYRQFCSQLLFPLMVEAHVGVSFAPWLRGSLEGISVADADRLLRGRSRLRPSVLTHVTAQALAARHLEGRTDPAATLVADAQQGVAVTTALVDRTAKVIERLRAPSSPSEWSEYGGRGHYDREALAAKDEFVRRAIGLHRPRQVLDLGCNDGRYAEIAAELGAQVVAVDADRRVVDALYQRLRSTKLPILPLVGDLADPSPSLGWNLSERTELAARVKPGLVLSLALIHHLVISRNIPIAAYLDALARLAPVLVLEVPHRSDPMVRRLLAGKPEDTHADYHRAHIADLVARRFEIDEQVSLLGGTRTLYLLRPR